MFRENFGPFRPLESYTKRRGPDKDHAGVGSVARSSRWTR